jgi:hypothetical protein
VSVRVSDQLNRVSTFTDAFFVRKDITDPAITNSMAGGDVNWQFANPGTIYDVDFFEGGTDLMRKSNLTTAQFRITSSTGGAAINWKEINAVKMQPTKRGCIAFNSGSPRLQ